VVVVLLPSVPGAQLFQQVVTFVATLELIAILTDKFKADQQREESSKSFRAALERDMVPAVIPTVKPANTSPFRVGQIILTTNWSEAIPIDAEAGEKIRSSQKVSVSADRIAPCAIHRLYRHAD
jgi:hypothetical protein